MAESRVALVTGANRGIGREIARQLANRGLTAVVGSRDAKGRQAAAALGGSGAPLPVVALDVADAESIRIAVAEVEGRFGRLDVLVNNAGILVDGGPSSGMRRSRRSRSEPSSRLSRSSRSGRCA